MICFSVVNLSVEGKSDDFSQYAHNICANSSLDSDNLRHNSALNGSSKIFDFNPTYNSYDNININGQGGLYSPDSVTSVDTVATNKCTSGLKKSVEDELAYTSDYGSPSGTNELSPAPSASPDHKTELEMSLYPAVTNSSLYNGKYDDSNSFSHTKDSNKMCYWKMNVNGDPFSLSTGYGNAQNVEGSANVIQQPSQTPPVVFQSNVMSQNSKKEFIPVQSRMHNIQMNSIVQFPSNLENFGKVLAPGCTIQNISSNSPNHPYNGCMKELNFSSGNRSNYRRILGRGRQVYESAMQKNGFDRLVDICKCDKKKSSLLIQWVTALVETGRLDEVNQSL